MKHGRGITSRQRAVPLVVFHDAKADTPRCINGLHVQTFIANPFEDRKGTLITFDSGDTVTVADDFLHVFNVLCGFVDG